jgi:Family of unknown function (DUF5681)
MSRYDRRNTGETASEALYKVITPSEKEEEDFGLTQSQRRLNMLPFRPANPKDNEPIPVDGQVGYKRPPAKYQFRKGQSGNPRGRWRGQRNLPAVLAEVLDQTVPVEQGNKSERMRRGDPHKNVNEHGASW